MAPTDKEKEFAGKVVFVAGGSSGINFGIVKGFAEHGAKVAIASRSQERVDAAVAELKTFGGEVRGYSADVRDAAAIGAVLKAAHDELGEFDVLVSGAAGNFVAPALGMSANGFKTVIDIDLNGTFHVLRAGYEFLKKPGASIINISAPQSINPMPYQAHVCAAKAGVDMLTRVLALEWGPEGVRVNSIIPGPIDDTEGMRRLAPGAAATKAVANSVPLRRLGKVSEIADMAIFLSSARAAYVTGAVIPVDGGSALCGGMNLVGAAAAAR